MGFKAPRKLFVLKFEDEKYEGLVVKAKSLPVGQFLEMGELASGFAKSDKKSFDPKIVVEMFSIFSKSLHEWNLEDDNGDPIPTTVDGLQTLELDFVMLLVEAWMDAIASVSVPLDKKSNNGGTPSTESLPMEPL